MKRADLEHLVRAASAITKEYAFVVVGSQSILGAVPHPPAELAASIVIDVYPLNRPDLSDLIDGSIGEGSPFHEMFGYYAQGVGPETAVLPEGWKDRLIRVQNENTHGALALCLDPADMAASKLAAGRDKDWDFVRLMLRESIVSEAELVSRIKGLLIDDTRKLNLCKWAVANSPPAEPEP